MPGYESVGLPVLISDRMRQPSDSRASGWRAACELGMMPGRTERLSRSGPYRFHPRCPAPMFRERLWQDSELAVADHMGSGNHYSPERARALRQDVRVAPRSQEPTSDGKNTRRMGFGDGSGSLRESAWRIWEREIYRGPKPTVFAVHSVQHACTGASLTARRREVGGWDLCEGRVT